MPARHHRATTESLPPQTAGPECRRAPDVANRKAGLLQHRDDARHPRHANQAQGFPRQCEPSRHPATAGYRGAAQRPHSDQQIHHPSFSFQINLETFSHAQPCSKSSRSNGTETALTAILVAAIEVNVPELIVARAAIGEFQSMIRSKTARKLDEWLESAKNSLVGSFAGGVAKDLDAVRNAILSPWSNGQTEGQVTRLKLIKRQMYGRAKLDLLQARLIGAA